MALEALDEAMDLMYSPDTAAAVGSGQQRHADPLDVFLGSLLPGADVGEVDSYIEEIMGPDQGSSQSPNRASAIDVAGEQLEMEQGDVAGEPLEMEQDAMGDLDPPSLDEDVDADDGTIGP